MDYKELIEELKGFSYWLGQSVPESHDIHPRVCDKAAAAIETILMERDAAVEDIERRCETCKHFLVFFNGCTPDYDCDNPECRDSGANIGWEWRGPKNEENRN